MAFNFDTSNLLVLDIKTTNFLGEKNLTTKINNLLAHFFYHAY